MEQNLEVLGFADEELERELSQLFKMTLRLEEELEFISMQQ